MTTTWVYEDLSDRIGEQVKEAVAELNTAFPVTIGPAMVNTLPHAQVYLEQSSDIQTDHETWEETRRVRLLFLVGESTEGFDEDTVRTAVRYLQLVVRYFHRNTRLTSTLYDTAPTYLSAGGVRLVEDVGIRAFQTSNTGSTRLGFSLSFDVMIAVPWELTL